MDKHFEWMRTYQIDGALLQRFVNSICPQRSRETLYFEMSGPLPKPTDASSPLKYHLKRSRSPNRALQQLQEDWEYLSGELNITSSPSYLRDWGEPVVGHLGSAIW